MNIFVFGDYSLDLVCFPYMNYLGMYHFERLENLYVSFVTYTAIGIVAECLVLLGVPQY